jgi:peptide/nickel transport system permease protein
VTDGTGLIVTADQRGTTAILDRPAGVLSELWRSTRRDPYAMAGLSVLGILVLLAVLGPSLAPYEGAEIIRDESGKVMVLQPPSAQFWFGTTAAGRDVFSQMLYGARPVLIVGLICALIPTAIGYILGLTAGYLRGGVDTIISRLVEIFYAIPSDPFAIVMLVLLSPSLFTLVLAISLTYWRRPTRVVRNYVLTLTGSSFIKSARVSGASSSWIIFRHLAPLSLPLAFVYVPIGFANAVLAEASLSFLGFGDPHLISWGGVMRDAFNGGALYNGWWWIVPPGVAITLTAVSMFLVTRPFEEVIDPRLREKGAV